MRAWLIAGFLVTVVGAPGQSPPAFDVASVKMSQPGVPGGSSLDPGRISIRGETLQGLILSVYKVAYWRVSGGPDWVGTDGYDITATFPPNTSQDQIGIMLQNLLADRFKLAIHRDMRDSSVYALEVAKGGPKFKEAATGKFSARIGKGHLEIHHADMALFARNIPTDAVDRPIVDMTGLQGAFDFTLDWAQDAGGPSIFTAVQEQLGLRLEARRLPIGFIVIDHIERPSEN